MRGIERKGSSNVKFHELTQLIQWGSPKVISNTSDRLIESSVFGYFEPAAGRCVPQYTVFNDRLSALAGAFFSNRLQILLAKQALKILQHFLTFACN